MKTVSHVVLGLAAFLVTAGLAYVLTSHEVTGGSLVLAASVVFAYVAFTLRAAVRGAERAEPESAAPEEAALPGEGHVGPTIWPFAFSIAGVALALGIVVARWFLAAAGAVFVISAVGWSVDIRRQRRTARRLTPDEPRRGQGGSGPQEGEQRDEDDCRQHRQVHRHVVLGGAGTGEIGGIALAAN